MEEMTFKRGDTFLLSAEITDAQGQPVIIPVAQIRSQIRDDTDQLIATLSVAETLIPGTYRFRATDTTAWPANVNVYMDVQLEIDGEPLSSNTVKIFVEKDITQ